MENNETNKTAEINFCKAYTEFHGEVIDNPIQVLKHTFTGEELMEFCEFYHAHQSKEKDKMLKELAFANKTVREKHELATKVIADQDEEIKRLRGELNELNMIWSDRFPDCVCNKHEKRYCASHSDGPDC